MVLMFIQLKLFMNSTLFVEEVWRGGIFQNGQEGFNICQSSVYVILKCDH